MNNIKRRVGCYVRVSTENQLENYSIEEQIERLKSYCKAKDWTVYKVYTDGGFSGGNIDRPALNQMLLDIKRSKIDLVIVYKLDRLSRSQKDTLTLIEDEFLANNVDFVSMSENFDTSSPFGRAMIGILSVFAQLEKDQITERFTMGRIGRGKAGYYHGGPTPPTGYKFIDSELIVDEYQSMQVKEVYDRFLRGYSINSIKEYMHEKYGGWTSHSLVINVLRNTVYIGKVKFKKIQYDGIHEPIIPIETFEQVQALLHSRKREDTKNKAQKRPFKASNLLTSLIECEKCGSRYSGCHGYYKCYSRSKTDKKYVTDPNCRNKNWEIGELDKIVISEIIRLKHDGEFLKQITDVEKPQDLTTTKERLKEIEIQISKIIDLYQVGSIPVEQLTKRIDALQKEKTALEIKFIERPKRDIKKVLSNFEEIIERGSFQEKRMVINDIIDTVNINENAVNIKWKV